LQGHHYGNLTTTICCGQAKTGFVACFIGTNSYQLSYQHTKTQLSQERASRAPF